MPSIDLEFVANISYGILLLSYIMRDILWLRILTVISLCFEIPYFYFQADPLWDGIGWDAAFIAINIYWVARLVYERRPVRFTEEQERIYHRVFHRLRPRHFRKLFGSGTRRALEPNETILEHGDSVDEVVLITKGKVELQINGRRVEELDEGHFVGMIGYFERNFDLKAVTTIRAVEPTKLIVWDKHQLRKLADDDPELGLAVDASLAIETAQLLLKSWNREAQEK